MGQQARVSLVTTIIHLCRFWGSSLILDVDFPSLAGSEATVLG